MEETNIMTNIGEPEVPWLRRQHAISLQHAVGDLVHVLHTPIDFKAIKERGLTSSIYISIYRIAVLF